MPDRSKVMTQTKMDTLILQVGVGCETDLIPVSKMPQVEFVSKRRCGYMENGLKCVMWNFQTLFKTTALISLLFQLKKYRLSITALQ
jgi:hypothetical protein